MKKLIATPLVSRRLGSAGHFCFNILFLRLFFVKILLYS